MRGLTVVDRNGFPIRLPRGYQIILAPSTVLAGSSVDFVGALRAVRFLRLPFVAQWVLARLRTRFIMRSVSAQSFQARQCPKDECVRLATDQRERHSMSASSVRWKTVKRPKRLVLCGSRALSDSILGVTMILPVPTN